MIELIPVGNTDEAILEAFKPGSKDIGFNRPKNSIIQVGWERQTSEKQRGKMLATVLIPTPPGQRNTIAYPRPLPKNFFQRLPNFIFDEAEIAEKRALISLKRLRQEFYGLPQDENLFRKRAPKEAVHELGHTYGLGHCTDLKGWNFCHNCRKKVSPSKRTFF